jgi:anti-anti-sigma factor
VSINPVVECPSQSLIVSAVSSGPRLVVTVAGEADWATADHLGDQLTQALAYAPRSVILDLAELEFCNLRGLGVLHDFLDLAQQASIDVTVRGMPRQLSWLITTLQQCVRAGARRDEWRAERPLLRAVPETPSDVGCSWHSHAGD